MKIFAKRKKTATPSKADGSEETKLFESDKVVEELLQQDPKEWNAKQRRMIKRYQDRKASEQAAGIENTSNDGNDKASPSNDNQDEAGAEANDEQPLDNDNTESTTKEERPESSGEAETEKKGIPNKPQQNEPESTTNAGLDNSAKASTDDAELDGILQQLNSKQRRLLSRRLEREGSGVREEIYKEALVLLEQKNEEEKAAAKSEEEAKMKEKEQESKSKAESSKSKKRKEPDWSALPPDERQRREEQRRLQQEAAERKKEESNGSSPHRHPLNSERRRANRRKPKWTQRKAETPTPKTTHNSSGFHIRKKQKV